MESYSKISVMLHVSLPHWTKSSRIVLLFAQHRVHNIPKGTGMGQDPLYGEILSGAED